MIVRRETHADPPAVRAVAEAAFGRPLEADLLDRLRACDGWLAALSLVATDPAPAAGPAPEVVGHVVCTRGHVGDVPVLGLGPLSVRPDRQRRGVGLALVHAVLGAAEALDEPLVALLGSPEYYGRYGFRPAAELGVVSPDPGWGEYFQARRLATHLPAPRGPFRYAPPFEEL
ncbi:N-acetyltransferase [Streptomyces sp. B6B3]|uniref:GNAT family N-acetyltransferase n=1 Tax=Streptomyces sp. B6B3 TaxID=3153570 RepID=UPI00325C71A7